MALGDAILACLTERPMTGYELAKTFDASIGFFWKANHQQIYRELTRLRDSLRRVNGLPADSVPNDRFDSELVTLVEDFQRKNRLAVDGIAGVQTQVALDAALNDAATPFLHNASGS